MQVRRFHLPPWSDAAFYVRRRCASALTEVIRYPVSARDDGEPVLVRIRTEHTLDRRHRQSFPKSLTLEIDLPKTNTHPARRADVVLPATAKGLQQWLAMLGKEYVGDKCVVGYGHWDDARLQFEDRGADKLCVDVVAPDDWTVPAEWKDAEDVTDDPRWSRALLTAQAWPVAFAPIEPQPAAAWGAPLEPAKEVS